MSKPRLWYDVRHGREAQDTLRGHELGRGELFNRGNRHCAGDMEREGRRILHNTGWLYARFILTSCASLLVVRLLIRSFGVSGYGVCSVVFAALEVVVMGSGFLLAWSCLSQGMPAWMGVASVALTNILAFLCRLWYVQRYLRLPVLQVFRRAFLPWRKRVI